MAKIRVEKVVGSLPSVLKADTIYYVRVGSGFDTYLTNSAGIVVAYPLNNTPKIPILTKTPSNTNTGDIWIVEDNVEEAVPIGLGLLFTYVEPTTIGYQTKVKGSIEILNI